MSLLKAERIIPVLRIFDHAKALGFYVDWLGFKINFEHRFEPGLPVYIEVQRENICLHLSEHHGDGTPGTHVFVWMEYGVAKFHEELLAKEYKYNRPGLHKAFYEALSFTVHDPFGNQISFNEKWDEDVHKNLNLCPE